MVAAHCSVKKKKKKQREREREGEEVMSVAC